MCSFGLVYCDTWHRLLNGKILLQEKKTLLVIGGIHDKLENGQEGTFYVCTGF